MFRLHDQTRRRVSMGGFLLLCVVPVAGVSLWCAARHWPGRVEAEARRLSREIGLQVSLEGVRYLRPGVVRYEKLRLADPETGRTVLGCSALEARWTKTADDSGPRVWSLGLVATTPDIEAANFNQLAQLLGRLLRSQTGQPVAEARLTSKEARLRWAEDSLTLTSVEAGFGTSPQGAQIWASFSLADAETAKPVRIRVARNCQIAPAATDFELDTGGATLPCQAVAMGLSIPQLLTPHSRFAGSIWASRSAEGWSGQMAGQLLEVDLGRLMTDFSPYELSGTAQLGIESARFRAGRLEEVTGTLAAGPGMVSRSLLDAAVGRLGLVRGAEPQTPGPLAPYEWLALAFRIDASGLELRGRCPAAGPGAILIDRRNRLLSEPVIQPRPVVTLVRTLVPGSGLEVPATEQAAWLIRYLPPAQATHDDGFQAPPPRPDAHPIRRAAR
jgi:hypothetical protein